MVLGCKLCRWHLSWGWFLLEIRQRRGKRMGSFPGLAAESEPLRDCQWYSPVTHCMCAPHSALLAFERQSHDQARRSQTGIIATDSCRLAQRSSASGDMRARTWLKKMGVCMSFSVPMPTVSQRTVCPCCTSICATESHRRMSSRAQQRYACIATHEGCMSLCVALSGSGTTNAACACGEAAAGSREGTEALSDALQARLLGRGKPETPTNGMLQKKKPLIECFRLPSTKFGSSCSRARGGFSCSRKLQVCRQTSTRSHAKLGRKFDLVKTKEKLFGINSG